MVCSLVCLLVCIWCVIDAGFDVLLCWCVVPGVLIGLVGVLLVVTLVFVCVVGVFVGVCLVRPFVF